MAWHRTSGNNGGKLEVKTASGDIASFETNLVAPLQSVLVNVLATGGNGTPDSPIPINGYTEANITRCGVNFFDKSTVTSGRIINGGGNDVSFTGWNVSDYIPVKEGAEFYLYGLTTHPNSNQDNFIFFNASKTKIGFANVKTWEYPLTIPSGVKFVKCTCSDTDLNTAQFSPTNNAPYAPYNGQTYTVNFGQTVYGGVLDVTRGKFTDTFDDSNFSDITGWSYGNGFFRTLALKDIIKKPTSQTVATNALCSIYKSVSWNTCGDNDFEFAFNAVNGEIIIKDSRYTDVPTFLAGVSSIPLVYELATPFDIDLTPEVISAVVGTNNVFAGCGSSTVEYLEKQSGSGMETVLDNGQVSTTSSYVTASFDKDVSDLSTLVLRFKYEDNGVPHEVVEAINVSDIPVGGSYQFAFYYIPVVEQLLGTITRTSITLTNYRGTWRDIFVDIKGMDSWQ